MKSNFWLILACLPFISAAQKYDQTWAFGDLDNISLQFTDSIPITDSLHSSIAYFFTSANICDTEGNLLFYTNGRLVMNRNGDTMINGYDFSPQLLEFVNGYYDSTIGFQNIQGALILPQPNSDSLYYLFQVDFDSALWHSGLTRPYSLMLNKIDMAADGGLGEVIEKNKIIFQDTMSSAGMTACKHANGRDWWLVRKEYHTNCYYIWLVTPDSVIGPSKQCLGIPIDLNDTNSNFEFSPNGNYFAQQLGVGPNDIGIQLMAFNRCVGELSNPITVDIPDSFELGIFGGVTFSPDGRFVYGFTTQVIYQIDLDSTDIPGSLTKVSEWNLTDTTFGYFGDLAQLAPDGKIYIQGVFCNPALSVINAPNEKGVGADVTLQSFVLPTLGACGIPNIPNYQLGALPGSPCDTLATAATVAASNQVNNLRVIPNPNDGRFTVSYQLPQNKQGFLTITNTLCKEVYRTTRPQWSSIQTIDLRGLPAGIYMITLESNGTSKSVKFIKQ